MKPCKTLHIIISFFILSSFFSSKISAQKIDTDSLLNVIIQDMRIKNDYQQNIKRSLLGKKLAPDYLDFHLLLGRNYDLIKQKDSARYYYNYVIEKNPKYEDAYLYLINLDIQDKQYTEAEVVVNKAIEIYPENKNFRLQRISIYALQNDSKNEAKYLKTIKAKYPEDPQIQQLIVDLYSTLNSNRIGVYYSLTSIDREGVGPWHLGSVDYIRQKKWGSLIGRVSYANRYSYDMSIAKGIQFEAESYIYTGKKTYSYFDAAYSPDVVFPKIRLAYSFYYNWKSWEADLGFRYTKSGSADLTAINIGTGKYIGSFWLNFRTYLQKHNPAFIFSSRYYLKTKFDYLTLIGGYGTSPDDRTTLGQLEQRVQLSSYRMTAGYSKLFSSHYIIGISATYNNQEYAENARQKEVEAGLSFQYKF
ncbi:YaiO family outer membrane beta-barrel protein [Flavobacterium sp. GA093]|uniref:YaiO family outer membrane beta-barrel protein n=1 Tax=Flavobacterium hydrocarbonoxydans TaxID=2683249 RepID=A0A6I4NKR2_9FLAO|nr:YaiO family outer membrane beta-barrel protein [Flavobacterium hydrocarbonoxydans]MWB94721.1 YaiO family outer membrane beta-barrel protein [Flavobacterium hydrocarbonoxydans]